MKNKKFLKTISNILILSVISFLYFINFNQSINAATDGNFSIQIPNGSNLIQGCTYSANIIVNTGSNQSNAADIIINYDPNKIEIIDSKPNIVSPSQKQIATGNAYEVYPMQGNLVDEINGIIRLAGVSLGNNLNGSAIFGVIQFKSKPGATNGAFNIKFDGVNQTLDSNIADYSTSLDVLNSINDASFNFLAGSCFNDNIAPNINFVNPQNNQNNVPLDQNIQINLSDNISGIDINSLEILVNGVVYTSKSPEITITGNTNNYTIVLNPNENFYSNSPSSVVVKVKDFASNSRQSSISFNFPIQITPSITPTDIVEPDLISPQIQFINPISNQNISNLSPITLNLTDIGSGINLESLVLYVNGARYTINDSNLTHQSIENGYLITVNDNFNFPNNSSSYISVFVNDNSGNSSSGSINFNLPKTDTILDNEIKPCPAVSPITCATNAPLFNEVNNIQNTILDNIPSFLEPIVEQTGFMGIASFIALMPLLSQILIAVGGVILGGFLWPLFLAIFSPASKKPSKVLDKYSKEGISWAKIYIKDQNKGNIIKKLITDFRGRFNIDLAPGKYNIEIQKKNYITEVFEINIEDEKDNIYVFELNLDSNSGFGTKTQFETLKFNPILLTTIIANIIASINLIYIRSLFAIVLFIFTLILVLGYIYFMNKKKL